MEIKYVIDDKNEAEIELDNSTIAEILRVQLNKDSSVKSVAWRKEHPDENCILAIKTSGKSVKKAVDDAVSSLDKELNDILDSVKKLK